MSKTLDPIKVEAQFSEYDSWPPETEQHEPPRMANWWNEGYTGRGYRAFMHPNGRFRRVEMDGTLTREIRPRPVSAIAEWHSNGMPAAYFYNDRTTPEGRINTMILWDENGLIRGRCNATDEEIMAAYDDLRSYGLRAREEYKR